MSLCALGAALLLAASPDGGAGRSDKEQRRAVLLAIDRLNANAQHPPGMVPTVEGLVAAEAALAALKEEVERARPIGRKDRAYRQNLAWLDASVVRHEQAFDEAWAELLRAAREPAAQERILQLSQAAQARSAAFRAEAERVRAALAKEPPR